MREYIKQTKRTPKEAAQNYILIQIAKGCLTGTWGVDDPQNDLIEAALGVCVAVGRKTIPIMGRLAEHVIVKTQRLIYCPMGAAFVIKIDEADAPRTVSVNEDIIRFGDGSTVTGVQTALTRQAT